MSDHIKKMKAPFTTVVNGIFSPNKLSLQAMGLYAFMYSKPDNWVFSINRLYAQLPHGSHSIRKTLNELKDARWVEYKKYADGTSEYILHIDPSVEIHHQGDSNAENPNAENPNAENPNVGIRNLRESTPISKKELISKKEGNNKDSSNNSIVSFSESDNGLDYSFEDFYKLYPNKKSKDKAYQVWSKAIKSQDFPQTYSELHNCLLPLIVKVNFGFPMKFIKHPTTWLNQGCWTDEYSIQEIVEELVQDISDFSRRKDKRYEIQDFINNQTGGLAV